MPVYCIAKYSAFSGDSTEKGPVIRHSGNTMRAYTLPVRSPLCRQSNEGRNFLIWEKNT